MEHAEWPHHQAALRFVLGDSDEAQQEADASRATAPEGMPTLAQLKLSRELGSELQTAQASEHPGCSMCGSRHV